MDNTYNKTSWKRIFMNLPSMSRYRHNLHGINICVGENQEAME